MSDLALSSKYAKNAILDLFRGDALSAEGLEFLTPTTAKNALRWRRIGMDAPKLSI